MGCILAKYCCPAKNTEEEEENEDNMLLDSTQRFFKSPAMIRRDLEMYFGSSKNSAAEQEGHRASEARRIALARAKPPG